MRLIPVDTETSIPTKLRCAFCGHWFNSGELYADLDGTPFQAYYCHVDSVQFESRGERVPQTACANKLIGEGARVLTRDPVMEYIAEELPASVAEAAYKYYGIYKNGDNSTPRDVVEAINETDALRVFGNRAGLILTGAYRAYEHKGGKRVMNEWTVPATIGERADKIGRIYQHSFSQLRNTFQINRLGNMVKQYGGNLAVYTRASNNLRADFDAITANIYEGKNGSDLL